MKDNTFGQADQRLVAQIAKGEAILAEPVGGGQWVDRAAFTAWKTQTLSYLINLLGDQHTYVLRFDEETSHRADHMRAGVLMLSALREDVADGMLGSIQTLLVAEVFSDFLEMASHLLSSGYKDPAAMLAGAVLEDGLKRVALKKGVPVKKTDDISATNSKLAQAGVYNPLVQKKIGVLNQLRNFADHGDFGKYSVDEVEKMISEIGDFLTKYLS